MKISIDHNSAIPLYLQIENQLRNIIREPEYKKGKMLPNEVDLSKQLGISRNTLRQAINNLVTEGLLVRKKGIGTIVVNQSVSSKAKNWLSFTQEMKARESNRPTMNYIPAGRFLQKRSVVFSPSPMKRKY